MCSLFDYLANKLSKDKNVDSSVNISDEKHDINIKLATFPTKQKLSQFTQTLFFIVYAPLVRQISLLPFGGSELCNKLLTTFKTGSVNICPGNFTS